MLINREFTMLVIGTLPLVMKYNLRKYLNVNYLSLIIKNVM